MIVLDTHIWVGWVDEHAMRAEKILGASWMQENADG